MQFISVMRSLLPPGHFWEIKGGSSFHRLLLSLSDEMDRVSLLINSIPRLLSYSDDPSRWMKLLSLKESFFKSDDAKRWAISSFLQREGNLSRIYVEGRLKALGYSRFEIHDPTEDDMGLEPIVDPDSVGIIAVKTQITQTHALCAGFPVGAALTEWRDLEFEKHLGSLLPAHVSARFLYRKQEDFHAESITS